MHYPVVLWALFRTLLYSIYIKSNTELLVGVEGFEPPTTCTQNKCATRLRYTPIRCGVFYRALLKLSTYKIRFFKNNRVKKQSGKSFLVLARFFEMRYDMRQEKNTMENCLWRQKFWMEKPLLLS